jgi:two-component system sensor histidine kinase BarA
MAKTRDNAESADTDLPSWDNRAALEAAGGDINLACELVNTLVQGLPNELSDLRRCFQANDWPLLIESAHRMRGATSYCGVPALDNQLQDLERCAKSGEGDQIGRALARVEQEADRLMRYVTRT